MRYQFPNASHIDTYLAAIAGSDEFIVKRDTDNGVMIINYVFATPTTFPDPLSFDNEHDAFMAALRRECRGIEFDIETGEIVTRKYSKFFNVNEKPETQMNLIDWTQPHLILAKLDGSMVTPFLRKGVRQWHTKMGATDVANPVNEFVRNKYTVNYNGFCDAAEELGMTPIFEWCSRQQRIVIDYENEALVLTGMRYKVSGAYVPHTEMLVLAFRFNVPVVEALPGNATNIQKFLDDAKDVEGVEGYVIRFADGHNYKVKGQWYCQIHGTKDTLSYEKNVWAMILEERVDDVKPFMDPDDLAAVENFITAFDNAIQRKADELTERVKAARILVQNDKKRFAIEIVSKCSPMDKALMFAIWDDKNAVEVLVNFLQKNCGTRTKLESVRSMVGGVSWDRYYKAVELDN